MQLKPGTRLRSVADETEVVVVRSPGPDADIDVRCGGHAMVPIDAEVSTESVAAGFDGGTLVGKRYADDDLGLELLCSKPGAGSLSIGDVVLGIKGSKPLPSSD